MDVKAKSLIEGDSVLELRWQRTKINCSMEEGMTSRSYIDRLQAEGVSEGGRLLLVHCSLLGLHPEG